MQFEDHNPEEFLFGKLPSKEEKFDLQSVKVENPELLDIILILVGVGYALTIFSIFQLIAIDLKDLELNLKDIGIFVFALLILSFLATIKNYTQMQRNGPFLKAVSIFSVKNMALQLFVSSVTLSIIGGLIFYGLSLVKLIPILVIYVSFAFFFFILYSRFLSNLALITSGLGIGLIPTYGGINNVIYNLRILYELKGKKDTVLAFLRLTLLGILYYTSQIKSNLFMSIISISFFTFLFFKWESENGFSICLNIWMLIQKMSPSSIPDTNFSTSFSLLMQQNHKPIRRKKQDTYLKNSFERNFNKTKKDDPISPTKQDLTPFAARSINRIASSILEES